MARWARCSHRRESMRASVATTASLAASARFGIRVLGPERIHGEIPIHGELDTQVLKPEPRGHQAKRAEPLEPPLRSRRKCTRSGHRRIIDESFGRNKSSYLCVLELGGAVDDRLLVDAEIGVSEIVSREHDDDDVTWRKIQHLLPKKQLFFGKAVAADTEVQYLPALR